MYDRLADEYYDAALHPTSHAFGVASSNLVAKAVRRSPDPRSTYVGNVLEVGAGRGYLRQGEIPGRLVLLDGSRKMLEQHEASDRASLIQADAAHIPLREGTVDTALALLADPYNQPATWVSVHRVLRAGGVLMVTLPTYEWASQFRTMERTRADRSRFVLRNGHVLDLPSYVNPPEEQRAIFQAAGFVAVQREALRACELSEVRAPKVTDVLEAEGEVVELWLMAK